MARDLYVETPDARRFERALGDIAKRAIPYAARSYLNDMAFETRSEWMGEAKSSMRLRSKFTESSIRVKKATGLNIDTMEATTGSIADYMATQESGATEGKKGKHGVPIPAAPQGKRGAARGRTPKAKQLGNIRLHSLQKKSGRGGMRRQALMMGVAKSGGGNVFMRFPSGNQGIYSIKMGAKRLLVRKLWDLSKSSVTIPQNPMLDRALAEAQTKSRGFAKKAILFQLSRIRMR